MVDLEEIEQITRSEVNLLSHLERMLNYERTNQKTESLDPELVSKMEQLARRLHEISERMEEAFGGEFGQLLALKNLIEEEETLESELETGVEELEEEFQEIREEDLPDDISTARDIEEELPRVINKLEQSAVVLRKDLSEVEVEVNNQLEQKIRNRIFRAMEELNSRPVFFLEATEEDKLQEVAGMAMNQDRETGGFFHFRSDGKDFLLDSFFHEPNSLQDLDIDSINSMEQAKEVLVNTLGLPEKEIEQDLKDYSSLEELKEELREMKNHSSYAPSSEVHRMMEKFYGRENMITWHNHPEVNKYSYRMSKGDVNYAEEVTEPIGDYRYELLVQPFPADNPGTNNIIAPNRWQTGVDDVQLLPVWITRNGEKLGLEEMKSRYPQLVMYNKALIRATAAGRESKTPLYLEDDHQYMEQEKNQKNHEYGRHRETYLAARLFKSIDVPLHEMRFT